MSPFNPKQAAAIRWVKFEIENVTPQSKPNKLWHILK